MRFVTAVFAAGILTAVTAAQAADKGNCYEPQGNADLSNITLGEVTVPKANFVSGEAFKAGCPAAGAVCQKKAFVVAQNRVVFDNATAKTPFVCAAYIGKGGRETDGWLPTASVKPVSVPPDWFGKWKRDTSARIAITRKSPSAADVSGDATWGEGEAMNLGNISAVIDPRQTAQGFGTKSDGQTQTAYGKGDPDECAVIFKQLGPYLFASDNSHCGGMNVNFSGIYTKR